MEIVSAREKLSIRKSDESETQVLTFEDLMVLGGQKSGCGWEVENC